MNTKKVLHAVMAGMAIGLGALISYLHDPATPAYISHGHWVPIVLALAVNLQVILAAAPKTPTGPVAALLLAGVLGTSGCAHITPTLKACGPDALAAVGTALVCDLADQAPLPACVISALETIGKDCDVSALVAQIVFTSSANVAASGDNVEAVKVSRGKAWLGR